MPSRIFFIKLLSQKKDWGLPKKLSLDEFARRKRMRCGRVSRPCKRTKQGQGKFATILTDLDKSSLLEVIDSHKSEDIITVLKQQPLAMREGVEEVCVDMWGGFPKVIREVFPNAKIVIDRFHVQKLVNKALNKIRLALKLKGLKNRCLLMNNQINLTTEDREELELILASSPSLRIGYQLKEELIAIYNSDLTPSGGMRKMKKRMHTPLAGLCPTRCRRRRIEDGFLSVRCTKQWLISARVMLPSAADTLNSHIEEICNYFINRTTSGVTEGLNTRIKLILRQSYGFKNFDMMKEKLLACLFK